jgi:hypothetical protein
MEFMTIPFEESCANFAISFPSIFHLLPLQLNPGNHIENEVNVSRQGMVRTQIFNDHDSRLKLAV